MQYMANAMARTRLIPIGRWCCYLASHPSYPNANDVERAQAMGVDSGDMIEIHGLTKKRAWLGPFHRISDWTEDVSR